MLKIKDNVDLKELEKYGFEESKWHYNCYSKNICIGRRGQCFTLLVYIPDKIIMGYAEGADGDGEKTEIDNTIYDLINDGLVEKVE